MENISSYANTYEDAGIDVTVSLKPNESIDTNLFWSTRPEKTSISQTYYSGT